MHYVGHLVRQKKKITKKSRRDHDAPQEKRRHMHPVVTAWQMVGYCRTITSPSSFSTRTLLKLLNGVFFLKNIYIYI